MNAIVIGGGVVGCAVAHELARRGAGVLLFDMRDVGRGASRASAGVLCPHIEGHAAPLRQLGIRSLDLYDRFIERVRADARLAVEYRRTGTLEVALTPDEAARLEVDAARHRDAGTDHRILDAGETRKLEPNLSSQVTGGLIIPAHGYVAAETLTAALAEAAAARGAQIRRGVLVRQVTARGDRVRAAAGDEWVEADAAVIAAGSWSGRIVVEGAHAPVKPIRGQLLHLSCAGPPLSRVIWGAGCYLVPWTDGSLLVGATVEDVGFDEGASVAGVRDLLDAACELLPPAWHARFLEVRVGLRPATSDEMPIIGPSSVLPGVFYATGHYRNGVLLAPITASIVADLVLERREAPELAWTRPARFGL